MNSLDRAALLASLAILLVLLTGCPPKQANTSQTSGDLLADEGASQEAASEEIVPEETLEILRANFEVVNFDFDRAELDERSRTVLADNAEILVDHPEVKVRIEGHADRWGSDIYNLALGQRRADAVRGFLLDLGVRDDQLAVISFGEEQPLAPEGDRTAEAPNRRAEFLVTVQSSKAEISSSY